MDQQNQQLNNPSEQGSRLRELKEELTFEELEKPYTEEEEAPGEPAMPSADQIALWAEIEKRAGDGNLKRDAILVALPAEIQHYLASEAVAQKIGEIAARHSFDRDRARIIAKSVLDLFLREIDMPGFINVLLERLGVDPETAKAVTKDIADGVLAPVKEQLKRIHQVK